MSRRGMLLLLVQLALVLTVAGKFAYDRATRPRLWVRTAPYDPETPLRGRYLSLQLQVNACGVPRAEHPQPILYGARERTFLPVDLQERNGALVAVAPTSERAGQNVAWTAEEGCARATLVSPVSLFLPEHAAVPLPLSRGQELWVEVTLPKRGEPRPIRLALSDAAGFHVLRFR